MDFLQHMFNEPCTYYKINTDIISLNDFVMHRFFSLY